MTLQDWAPLYSRLCAALGRKETPAQMRAYFDALSEFTTAVVVESVKVAGSRVWPPTRPAAGDVREIAQGIRRQSTVPAAVCDVCHGDRFTVTQCAGWRSGGPGQRPDPVDRQALCGRDFPHAAHEEAHPCRQCHPLALRQQAEVPV